MWPLESTISDVLQDMGELKEARKYFERALRREQVYGPDHSAVARDINNLGSVCLTWAN